MNQASNPTSSVAVESGGAPTATSIEDRAAAIFGTASPGGDPPAPVGEVAAEAPAPDALSEARAARRAALLQAKEQERQQVDSKTAIKERDELRKRLAQVEDQNKAYSAYIDPTKLTKEQFFSLAEKNPELTAQELGEWLRERMANPDQAAARAAKAAVDPEVAALKKQLADQQAALDEFKQHHQAEKAHVEEQHYAQQLHAFVNENASTAPLTARFVAAKGIEGLYDAALSVAQRLPAGAGPQAILDELEESLIAGQRDYASIYGNPVTTQQRPQANTPPQNQAAAKAPMHVSNTLAQQRSSVVDEQADFAKLTLIERANRLFGT